MAEIMCSFDVCVCVYLCVCLCAADWWELNANSSKTVKATDFKFDTRVPRDSSDLTPQKIMPKVGVFNNLLGGDMHSHERLPVCYCYYIIIIIIIIFIPSVPYDPDSRD